MKNRVALVTHDISVVGGLPTMTKFLYQTLEQSGRYEPELISLATSTPDTASLRLKAPNTWLQYPKIRRITWHDLSLTHVGACGSEFEFQRYRPRRILTEILKQYDLLQFVVGSPPWVSVAADTDRPILLWTATTTRADRASQLRNGSLARRVWASLMVPIAESYERHALKTVHTTFVLSDYTRAAVEPITGPEKVLVAPCGVDTDLFHPAERSAGQYILCVARFSDPRKNVRLLLEAFAILRERFASVPHLYLVGDPPTEETLRYLRSVGLEQRVHSLGPRQGEELAELYRNALFFVLSSNEEGLGIVILEAMASGLAVVSTACGGPSSAVKEGETGFLTLVGNAPALASAMETLVRNADIRASMGEAGRKVAEQRFSLDEAGQVFLDKYDEVLNPQRSEIQNQETFATSVSAAPAALI